MSFKTRVGAASRLVTPRVVSTPRAPRPVITQLARGLATPNAPDEASSSYRRATTSNPPNPPSSFAPSRQDAAPWYPIPSTSYAQQHERHPRTLTAGQHDAIPALIQPYSAFPKRVSGRTVWTKEQFERHPELWKRRWTEEQIRDLDEGYERWRSRGEGLTSITRHTFPFSARLTAHLLRVRDEIVHGPGFSLIQGLPVREWPREKVAAVYLAIGNVFGWAVSQNRKGHVLGHVKDLGADPTQTSSTRIYATTGRQFFHSDDSDMVGLLCLHRALQGGESDVVSTHHLWNTLQRERPDVAEVLTRPEWYYDRKGEVSAGQKEWVKKAVFYWHDGRLLSNYDPYYLKSGKLFFSARRAFLKLTLPVTRFADAGLIPHHTPAQLEAIQVLEETAQREALHMVLEVGDMQFVADTHVFHARTAYVDHPAPSPRRHLMRLWLSTPVSEGGWSRPFPDNSALKRGGVQVDQQEETCPLEAE